MDILIGLIIVALLALGVYVVTHHKPPSTVAGADLANTLASASSDAWEAVKRDLPSIVSAELAQAKAGLADMTAERDALAARLVAEVQGWRDKLAAAEAAHNADKAAVAARVAAAVTASPELPPSTLAPAVEAQDAARVVAFADQITPPPEVHLYTTDGRLLTQPAS